MGSNVANRKDNKTKKHVPVEVLDSDSSLVNIDDLLKSDSEESCPVDVDDLLKSSDDELCPVSERGNDNARLHSIDGGLDEIVMSESSEDEIVIVDDKNKLDETSGPKGGLISDLNDNFDSDIEIIELVNGSEVFSEKRIKTFRKLKMTAEV